MYRRIMYRHIIAATAALTLIASPALAQLTTTPPPAKAAPAKKQAPAQPERPAIAAKVNLNAANAQELDALPQIGPARAKAIIEARAKGRFKNWDDFVARKVVPSNAQRAIKDLVTF